MEKGKSEIVGGENETQRQIDFGIYGWTCELDVVNETKQYRLEGIR